MEIIEQGQLPEEKEYTAKCSNCQTKFKFQAKEALGRNCNRNESYLSVICPYSKCGKQMYVEVQC